MLLNEDSAAGTTGNKDIYQNFFLCLNYEKRKSEQPAGGKQEITGLYIQYGIRIDTDEASHLYLSYFDPAPLDPVYYSFGSRNSDVQVLDAHIEPFNEAEQVKLRCKMSSSLNKAIETKCDYECHPVCDGCTEPYNSSACKKCAHALLSLDTNRIICVDKCPLGHRPDLIDPNRLCVDINECLTGENKCPKNTVCVNTPGSYKCNCEDGFIGNGLFCKGIRLKMQIIYILLISGLFSQFL